MSFNPSMYRILPLLLFLTACAGDPLELHVAEVDGTEASDALTAIDLGAEKITTSTELLPEHGDLNLKFSFRAAEGTAATLLLQNKYAVTLPDLSVTNATPRFQTDLTPGVWQDLEVVFIAAQDDAPAILPAIYLNGSLVHYQQAYAANDAPAGPLTLNIESGELEIKDLRYSDQGGVGSTVNADGVSLNIPLLRYEYYDLAKDVVDVNNWAQLTPAKTGYINRFDLNAIKEKGSAYAIRFFGKLTVPKAGEYKLSVYTPASVAAYVDGQKIINDPGKHGARQTDGFIELSEGRHDFRLDYVQSGGWSKIDVKYQAPGESKVKFLNTMESNKAIAGPGAPNPQKLKTDDYPYLLRSFLYFPAPKVYESAEKRTHVISVGEADGPHYSLDLQSGALLQMWRGDFADTYDMWVGRGEPQVMRPLGPAIALDGAPQWGTIDGDDDRWPDTIAADAGFRHVRHTLDEAGRPTFEYTMKGGHSLSDKLTPENGSLLRELTHTAGGNTGVYTLVAAAREIAEVAPGEYALRGPGMGLKIESYDGSRLVLQRSGGKDRLLAEIPAKGHLTYRLNW